MSSMCSRLISVAAVMAALGMPIKVVIADDADPWQQKRVKVLVEMLASQNKDPSRGDVPHVFPNNYSREAQAVVFLAIEQLKAEGSAAFDVLIEHLDDERYSYSYETASGTFRQSVGQACRQILFDAIYGYVEQLVTLSDDDAPDQMKGLSLKAWWEANRGRPLWEIQAEGVSHRIQHMETLDRLTSKSIRAGGARGTPVREYRLSEEEFEKRRQQNLTKLRAMHAYMVTCKQHYRTRPPGTISGIEETMTRLPWPTAGPK